MVKPENVTAIVLCGGLGTRLHSVTNDKIPKPMVSVAGRPFLEYLLDYLLDQGVTKAILAVSHQSDMIIEHFGEKYKQLTLGYSIENEPLGTGGAIKHAIQSTTSKFVLVLNGDTFTEYDIGKMLKKLSKISLGLVIATKYLEITGRYGCLNIEEDGSISEFLEKKSVSAGNINAGVYLFERSFITKFPDLKKFSFEKDFLESKSNNVTMYSSDVSDGYFTDIGIPSDYYAAHKYFIKSE